MKDDFSAAALLALFFLSVVGAAELWARYGKPEAEWPRKFVHLFAGLGCLPLPWLVRSPYTVAGLAGGFALLAGIGERRGFLHCLAKIERSSHGSAYYPVAILILFIIAAGRPWLYVASLLVLAISDACAALVGGHYGRITYHVGEKDLKSLEGSIFFWLITFHVLQTTLLLMTDLPRLTCILAALMVSVLLTFIEAVSAGGSDNLFVPMLSSYILLKVTQKPADEMVFQVFGLFALFLLLIWMIAALRLFSIREAILFLLNAFAYWSLGGFAWALPVLINIILYGLVRIILPNRTNHEVQTASLLRALAVPLGTLITADLYSLRQILYAPFLLTSVLTLLFSIWIYLLRNCYLAANIRCYAAFSAGLTLMPAVALATAVYLETTPWQSVLWMSLFCAAFTVSYDRMVGNRFSSEQRADWADPMWFLELWAVAGFIGLQYLGVAPLWQ